MADLPADPRLRRTLIERIASVLEARMQRQKPTLRRAAETPGVSRQCFTPLIFIKWHPSDARSMAQ